ncbi:NAD-glutamate dehydrogenase [Rhizobium sp. CFBP 8762]|uniref:NAD-glutamate dehydrogenase n=1 Tax=Rhizobium sp. CFBP 8762 TaxID=2775279 RepID=UPI00177C9812|nr:NAD-glutamate dehydrogenase [Rhizobium sp. CFBP 8762]MBD8556735.1 NAD-glutamate dehydrogenase [Rhizobium sp. CFBP 8762]
MDVQNNPKRHEKLERAEVAARALARPFVAPELLLGRASADDLDDYSVDMLGWTAAHARAEIDAWDRHEARITFSPLGDEDETNGGIQVLAVTTRNKPFLYDSVMGEVTSTHRDIRLAIHPILVVDKGGTLRVFSPQDESQPDQRVSHIQIHIAHITPEDAEALHQRVRTVLHQVKLAVSDWQPMRHRLEQAIAEIEAASLREPKSRNEALAFLRWLEDNNFTFLGMRDYVYSGEGDEAALERADSEGLGILSDPDVRVLVRGKDAVTTTPEILAFLQGPDILLVTKANTKSVVHRRAYMDYIGVKRFDVAGNVVGELRIVGLFTSSAYTRQAQDIPLLRLKIDTVAARFGFDPQSHSGKMLRNTLESYPRDDLFQIDTDLLTTFCEQINELSDRPRIRVLTRTDRFDRFVSVIVYVPREQYDSDLREQIGLYLAQVYEGRVSAYYPAFPEGGLARVHFIIGRSDGRTPQTEQSVLETRIGELATRWIDRFQTLAGQTLTLETGQAYQAAFTPAQAFADLPALTGCTPEQPLRIALYRKEPGNDQSLELKIFHLNEPVSLSRRVPLLENLGFQVISEQTYELQVGTPTRDVVLHDMELKSRSGAVIDLETTAPRLEAAFLQAWDGTIEDDSFNRLIVSAGLTAGQVVVLRAYARYLRQTGITYSQGYLADTLNAYPHLAAALFTLFSARLDPELETAARNAQVEAALSEIETGLAAVPSLDEDRILRRYRNAIQATLRTNYFQRQTSGTVLALKFDPHALEGLPEPRPFREIFVYGVQVEGVHLRFGKVARGGLRWSDRAQDYRTEVLGLVKAQQVKNAVIVPVGAKGGFYPKQLPVGASRDETFAAGREAYKNFIRSLLSITDNIAGEAIVPPSNTVRLDGDDPYFVVAADKGTATFSDTANGLAQDAGFWLDDAFASGGSAGYDHKKMGITARGAWETVKRQFRELNIDIQTTPFTVVGVGDMSGDVFGNGMLLSQKIRLIAAFDHRDIFIDPNPDTDLSFAERKRLFDLPRSSWQDYDRATLSAGAMIISRSEKSVKLSPEAAAAIGLEQTVATPFEIISAILKAPVDLLWFGGIGTYIRAASESDADVGDKANDPIRVTAEDVRAKVIGEGANLGVTQRARIAYGQKGGRGYSDSIDNSAGVNSSDIEVNIKIALASAMRDNRLTREDRNTLLASMTDEVAELVLRNNYLQSLAISLVHGQGLANREPLARLMNRLEADGHLNRKVELLPTNQALVERYQTGKPLTRAEIGVLLSYSKLVLFEDVVKSPLVDDSYFEKTLFDYFPQEMHGAYADDICKHRLHREIIATVLGNDVINRGGPAFVNSLMNATGASADAVVKAAIIARDGLALPAIYDEIDALDTAIPGDLQNELYQDLGLVFWIVTERILQAGTASLSMEVAVTALQKALAELKPGIAQSAPANLAEQARTKAERYKQSGVPGALADEIATLPFLTIAPEILQLAETAKTSLTGTAESYSALSELLDMSQLLSGAVRVSTADQYEAIVLGRSIGAIAKARRTLLTQVLRDYGTESKPVKAWSAVNAEKVTQVREQLSALIEAGDMSLARVTVAAGLLNDLVEATSGVDA